MNKRYVVEIPIIRSNYNKTKSAKFKGNLFIVSNIHGIIYDWKIEFSELEIDLFSTKSIIVKKDQRYFRRKKLFDQLKFKQQIRMDKNSYKLKKLSTEAIKITNQYFNNRNHYKSTIKNILGVIKGSNPSGEAKNPKSAELVINNKENVSNINNFVILLDDLTMKNGDSFNANIINAKKIPFKKFVKLNYHLESAFIFMQEQNKNKNKWNAYLKNIKEYYKKYNNFISEAEKLASKARSQFNKNVENNISKDTLPFGFKSSKEFQKCHIYEYRDLRDKIIEALRKKKNHKKYEDMIKDHNNFIPLPEMIHRKFDNLFFTYKSNGNILPIHNQGNKFVEEYCDKYKHIPKFFLNNKRKKYIELRNQNINFKFEKIV